MARGDSNRISPDAVTNVTIQPQASPVSTEIKYQPMLSQAQSQIATADALASLGSGALAFDNTLHLMAEDPAFKLHEKAQLDGENKRQWADVSKNVTGLAKFNPYIKDAYLSLVAEDSYNAAKVKISSIANPEAMSPAKYDETVAKIKEAFNSSLTDSGIGVNIYAPYMEKFNTLTQAHKEQVTVANTEYNYKLYKTAAGAKLGTAIGSALTGKKAPLTVIDGDNTDMIQAGNIDLAARPVVKNPDGTHSTVKSASFNIDGKEVLLPTISKDGKNLTPEEAVAVYKKTGENLGVFKTSEAATKYANRLHEQQAHMYSVDTTGLPQNSADKARVISATINREIANNSSLGTPVDDTAQIVGQGIKDYVLNSGGDIDAVALKAAVRDVKIDGMSMSELIPDFEYNLDTLIRTAKSAKLDDMKADYEYKAFTLKIGEDKAIAEAITAMKKNPNMSPAEYQKMGFDLMTKYGLEQDGFSFLSTIAQGRSTMQSFKQVTSDPEVKRQLGYQAMVGTITTSEIGAAVQAGKLSLDDAYPMYDRTARADAAAVKHFDDNKKSIEKYFTDKKSAYYKYNKTGIAQNVTTALEDVGLKLGRGEITPQQADEIAKRIKLNIPQAIDDYNRMSKNDSCLTNLQYLHTQNIDYGYTPETVVALKRMGIARDSKGVPLKNVGIASAPNPKRTVKINGKTVSRPHTGYDIANIHNGQPVYPPLSGVVVGYGTGYNGGMGNYMIVKCDNGKYVKYMHLSQANEGITRGSRVDKNTPIAYVGSTGDTAGGASLHLEFFNENRRWIPPERFY